MQTRDVVHAFRGRAQPMPRLADRGAHDQVMCSVHARPPTHGWRYHFRACANHNRHACANAHKAGRSLRAPPRHGAIAQGSFLLLFSECDTHSWATIWVRHLPNPPAVVMAPAPRVAGADAHQPPKHFPTLFFRGNAQQRSYGSSIQSRFCTGDRAFRWRCVRGSACRVEALMFC